MGKKTSNLNCTVAGFLNHQQYVIDFCVFEVQTKVQFTISDMIIPRSTSLDERSGWSCGFLFLAFFGVLFFSSENMAPLKFKNLSHKTTAIKN